MTTKAILTSLVVTVLASECARSAPIQTGPKVVNSGCPSERPASWPKSQFRVAFGSADSTLDAQMGALIFQVRLDSIPGPQSAEVSLSNQAIRRDAPFGDSAIRITAPAGRYFFRARRIAAQTLQDSIDVRSRFVDTVKVALGREVLCLVFNEMAN